MAYSPEPTHPVKVNEQGDGPETGAQLNREFWAINNSFLQTNDALRGAVPWKAFNLILDGVGVVPGGTVNPILPVIFNQYNIDTTAGPGGTGVLRASEGVYIFTLLVEKIGGIDILPVMYPSFQVLIEPVTNLDPTAESVRVRLTNTDIVTGTLEITIEQLEVPASGKGTWTPYDLRASDRLWAEGSLNLKGQASSFSQTP